MLINKIMKKFTIVFLGMFAIINLQAQNYYINFTASGTTSILDSVFVQNLTQGTSLTLQGNDTLLLYGTASINSHNLNDSELRVYPNPFNETSRIAFYSETYAMASIDVYDIVGKHILHLRQEIQNGDNMFEISGFSTGHYQLIVKTEKWQKSAAFVSLYTSSQNPQIQTKSFLPNINVERATARVAKNIVQMSYTTGNQMRFTAYYEGQCEIVNDMPILSKTIDFVFSTFTCGNLFADCRDGNVYSTVQIGNQCWMAKNLAYLPSVVGSETGSYTTPYYYVYGYDSTDVDTAKATANYTTYGVLYNWPAAMAGSESSAANPSGIQGVCPAGWYLPSDAEWTSLIVYLGGLGVAGGKLKEADTIHWNSPNIGATNETGFTALPGGSRTISETFSNIGYCGYWRSATEGDINHAWFFSMFYNLPYVQGENCDKNNGFSVRCIRY